MENSVGVDYQKRKSGRMERVLIIVVSVLLVITGLAAAFLMYKYVSERDAPPQTYYDLEIRQWRAALEKAPKDPAIHTNLGYVYMKMGNESKALSYFDQALKLDKKFVPALYNLGIYYMKEGDKDRAVSHLSKAGKKAVKGNKFLAYYSLAELYLDEKDYDKAIDNLQKSLADNATIWNAYEKLGKIYEIKGDMKKAVANYEKALSFNPGNKSLQRKVDKLTNGKSANK